MDEPPHRFWPWIIATITALPLLYVGSFGPACWLCDHNRLPEQVAAQLYRPLIVATFSGPPPVRSILRKFAEWDAPPGPVFACVDDWGSIQPETFPPEFWVYGVLERLRDTE